MALLSLCLLPASLLAQTIAVAPERTSGLYETGETVRWTITVTDAANLRNPQYTVKSGGLNSVATGALALSAGAATIQTAGTEPGWLLLEVKGTNAAGSTVSAYGGAVVSGDRIKTSSTRPADFDAWWQAKLATLAAIPINPVVTAGTSDRADTTYATVTLDCINGTKVQGQLARPAAGEKFPALLILQWAGVYSLQKSWATYRASQGWLVLNTQAHDITPIESDAYYTALNNGALKDYPRIGNEDRETSYFLRMYLAAHRAAEYLTTRPDWDGRTLVVTGASQGGLQSLVVAGLHPKITAAITDVPAGADQGGLDVGRVPGWPMWAWQAWDRDLAKVKETARYFDVAHFAPLIRCPVLTAYGMIDTTVPPSSVYTVYNQLRGARQLVPMPLADHVNGHAAQGTAAEAWLADARTGRVPTITTAPQSAALQQGEFAYLTVTAANGPAYGYQWLKNGVAIPGATRSALALDALQPADAGDYSVVVTSPGGAVTSPAATVTVAAVPPAPPVTHMVSLSTRCFVGTGSSIGIAGFVLDRSSTVLVRGIGPTLGTYGVGDALAKPVLKLFDGATALVAQNTGWKSDAAKVPALTATMDALGAFRPQSDDDCALHVALPAGLYTAQLSGAGGSTGNGLIEVYLDRTVSGESADYFAALSSRCFVGTGSSVAVAGFVLPQETTVLLRAIGPTLAGYGVGGVLARPELKVFDAARSLVAENIGWTNRTARDLAWLEATMTRLGAFSPESNADSALRVTLPAGLYTAQVSGVEAGTGNALVEVYLVR